MSTQEFEYLIIGAGPAGIQLAYFLEKNNRDYCVLEKNSIPGSFFKDYPRHRKLISINKVHTGYDDPEVNMRWDWNSLIDDGSSKTFKDYSQEYFPDADNLLEYLEDYTKEHRLNISYNCNVKRISKTEDGFVVVSQDNTYMCKVLVVATGLFKPYMPPVVGIEHAKPYTEVSVEPADFINKRVLIIGKGNSAFETADNLIPTAALIHVVSPNSIKMAWASHFVGNLRAVNNNFLDTYQLKSQNAPLDANIINIAKNNGQYNVTFSYTHAQGEVEEITYDEIISCAGFSVDTSIFDDSARPETTIKDKFPKLDAEWQSSNVPDMYFAGTLMQSRDYKKYMSGFIHGFRYNVEALSKVLDLKYHDVALPHIVCELDAEKVSQLMLKHINRSSAIWQQPGFICDFVTVDEDNNCAKYHPTLAVDYVLQSPLSRNRDCLMVTLEYGEPMKNNDPFSEERIERNNVGQAGQSKFLHPVIRHYKGSELVGEHHIIEDLFAEWYEDVHIDPLVQFMEQVLTKETNMKVC